MDNDNDHDEMEVDNEGEGAQQQQQQQHQPVLLRRIPRHALNRRHNRHGRRPKFSIGTKISLTDNILYEQYENSMIIRLDGEIIGYERILIHTDDADESPNKYKWNYLVRFVDHNHLFEDPDQHNEDDDDDDDDSDNNDDSEEEMTEKEIAVAAAVAASYQIDTNDNGNRDESKSTSATTTATDSTTMEQDQQQYTFLKLMSETEIKSNLSNDDPSYIMDLYFGRNLREMIQVHHTLVRDRSLMPSSTQMNWCKLFQTIQSTPTIARARFPLYDEDGDVIGNFTILAMALLIILLNKQRDDDDDDNPKIVYDVDDITIIKTLLQFYPKGIEQGKYHDKNRQLKGGSKFLGILHFILENDDEEDQHIIYQNNSTTSDSKNEQPEYFANLLDPEILKLLITSPRCTSSYNHGQYLYRRGRY